MRTIRKLAVAAAVAVAASANVAQAQVTYSTEGRFVSGAATCNTAVFATISVCTDAVVPNFTLTFTGVTNKVVGTPTTTSMGFFSLVGNGTVTAPPGVVTFEMRVTQTTPTGGQTTFTGFVSGTVTTVGGPTSSLIWTPNTQSLNIGPVNYRLIYDNIGPAANVGMAIAINDNTSVQALITVPEPSSVILMASGLIGLAGVAIRRRRSA